LLKNRDRLLLSLFLLAVTARADFFSDRDSATRGPDLLKWDPSARSAGLGGAYAGVADDLGALYWNPAGLQQLGRSELQLSHSQLFADQSLSVANVGCPVWRSGHRETWGLGITYLAMDPFDVVSANAAVDQAQVSEAVASLSYARPWGPAQVGLTGKYIRQNLDVVSGQTYAFDLGLLGQSDNERWAWGLTAANMGPAMTVGTQEIGLPLVFRLGGSGQVHKGRRGLWTISAQADVPIDNTVQGHAGVEYQTVLSRDWRAAIRGGLQTDDSQGPFALGASLERGPLVLHYAFSENADLGVVNRLEVALKFGSPLAQETEQRALMDQARSALLAGDLTSAQVALDSLKVLSPSYRPAEKLRDQLRATMWETLDPPTLLAQGQRALEAGDPETAATFFRKLLVVQPDHPVGGAALEKAEKEIAARRLAQTRREVARDRERRLKNVIDQARASQNARQWDAALARWNEVLALDKNNTQARDGVAQCRRAYYDQAVAAQSAGDPESAKRLFKKLHENGGPLNDSAKRVEMMGTAQQERDRQLAKIAYDEGREAYRQGQLTKARSLFQEARYLNPDDKAVQRALERVEEELRRKGTP
jgi:tetratricopeptide (TPR) repeat protein